MTDGWKLEVDEDGLKIYAKKVDGTPLTITKMRIEGVSIQDVDDYMGDSKHFETVDPRFKVTHIGKEGEMMLVHCHMDMPMSLIVSHRSFFLAAYRDEQPDGSVLFLSTSLGNDEIAQQNKELMGKDKLG